MSRHAADRRPADEGPSRKTPSSDALVLLADPTEEWIDAEIMARLFRGAAPEAYRQAVAQRAALRREAAECRAQTRRLRSYTDLLLKTDVSGYSEQQTEDYRRELQRRSKECFGK